MDAWAPGTRLGAYELLALIGAGGMGEVWKARDTRLNRFVAIKRFKGPNTSRFQLEGRTIAALNHPHICQVHDVGTDYLVLEYIDGTPLPCPVDADEAVRLAIDIAGAIEAAHAQGIIHRDLKPANILMTRERSIKLLDFGIAKLTGETEDATVTAYGSLVGTAAYMSPEQAEGKPLDQRSDIFSFGAVLYEMLTGRRAFAGTTTAEVLTALLHKQPVALLAPAAVERVVKRCLAKRAADRFQSMSDVRRALEEIATKGAEPQPSVAVLPFSTMSADKQDEYFSDGLAEEIINALAHIPGLNVTARTSSFSFRGKDLDIRHVAETLGVRTILEGSVRRAGSRIRVTAQLINATNGYHLWSERYDREMADVFAIQDEIAEAIASSLKLRLSGDVGPARRHTPNIPAYEAYLKARHFLRKGTPESFRRGKEWLEQAIALDPNFAAAHVELASCFRLLASLGDEPTREALLQARAAAERAVKLDPALPNAHAHLAAVALFLDYDWEGAGRHFEVALSQEPRSPEVSHLHGFFYLVPLGRMQAAIEEMQESLKEDPLNLECLTQFAVLLWSVGRDDQARNYFDHVLELDEGFWLALFLKSLWLAERGAIDEGLPFAERAYAVAPKTPNSIGLMAGFLSLSGNVAAAEHLIETLGDGTAFGAPLAMSVYYMVRSDYETAADWVGKAIEQRDPNALPAACAPARRRFVANGRWPGLARMLRLPETATGELR